MALRAFYDRWPFGMSDGHFLSFPELRDNLSATLAGALYAQSSPQEQHHFIWTFVWALNDEGPGNTFVSVRLHHELAVDAWRSLRALASPSLRLPLSAEMAYRSWDLAEALHAFHITAMHGFGALVAMHTRTAAALEIFSDCALLNHACDSEAHTQCQPVQSLACIQNPV